MPCERRSGVRRELRLCVQLLCVWRGVLEPGRGRDREHSCDASWFLHACRHTQLNRALCGPSGLVSCESGRECVCSRPCNTQRPNGLPKKAQQFYWHQRFHLAATSTCRGCRRCRQPSAGASPDGGSPRRHGRRQVDGAVANAPCHRRYHCGSSDIVCSRRRTCTRSWHIAANTAAGTTAAAAAISLGP